MKTNFIKGRFVFSPQMATPEGGNLDVRRSPSEQ